MYIVRLCERKLVGKYNTEDINIWHSEKRIIKPWFCCFRYRPAPEDGAATTESASSPKKTRSSEKSGKSSVKSRKDELWLGKGEAFSRIYLNLDVKNVDKIKKIPMHICKLKRTNFKTSVAMMKLICQFCLWSKNDSLSMILSNVQMYALVVDNWMYQHAVTMEMTCIYCTQMEWRRCVYQPSSLSSSPRFPLV